MPIRAATPEEDPLVVRHYLAVWDSYGTPADHYRADAGALVLAWLAEARAQHGLGVFLAEEDGQAVGSACCQRFQTPYPDVVQPTRRIPGYVWSVYVEPGWRGRGLARQLVTRAVEHLRGIGCSRVLLHASQAGRGVYERLGFVPGSEMRLEL